jgi:hypothetical protein
LHSGNLSVETQPVRALGAGHQEQLKWIVVQITQLEKPIPAVCRFRQRIRHAQTNKE